MPSSTSDFEFSALQPTSHESMPDQQGGGLIDQLPREYGIISDGDLVLIVGQDKRRIRITIQAAHTTSSVLGTMLNESSLMGAVGQVVELKLPDDNSTAARNAFGSLYPGNPHMDSLTPVEIYDVGHVW
ncbi:hypothetical protein IL306_002087 [Fusarium sp. DS 682]|nr:hypothetical protein IL306_002087 [Fusarium sp. DS 682]